MRMGGGVMGNYAMGEQAGVGGPSPPTLAPCATCSFAELSLQNHQIEMDMSMTVMDPWGIGYVHGVTQGIAICCVTCCHCLHNGASKHLQKQQPRLQRDGNASRQERQAEQWVAD